MTKIESHNEKETFAAGFRLAAELKGGEVLALYGDLGAGKTHFLQGLAKGLGVRGPVNSPTFNILKLYKVPGKGPINTFCHIDAYRLASARDLETIGAEEYLQDKGTVTAIEWSERVEDILPPKSWKISLARRSETERLITIAKKASR